MLAANGTIIVTGRVGQSCACAGRYAQTNMIAAVKDRNGWARILMTIPKARRKHSSARAVNQHQDYWSLNAQPLPMEMKRLGTCRMGHRERKCKATSVCSKQ